MTLITAALVICAAACDMHDPVIPSADRKGVKIPVHLSCEPLDTETGDAAKSQHSASALTTVSNANYYLFHEGNLVRQEYFEDASSFSVTLPSQALSYNLYILANVGEVTIPATTLEPALPEAVHYDYGSRSNYFATIRGNGFPMSGTATGFSSSSSARFSLRRLVHTLYVRMNTDALSTTSMHFTGVQIRQAPRDIYPFAAQSRATIIMDGDSADLSQDDLDRLNAGQTVTLYLLENMRGDLLPGNGNWKDKVPSRLSSSVERGLASYIEMTAEVQTATALYANNIYRAYLGTSPQNFDVERSTYFHLNNNFTNDMVTDEDWRMEADEPEVNARLCFADTRFTWDTAPAAYRYSTGDNEFRPFREVDSFPLMKGFTAVYYIYRSNPGIEYTLTADHASGTEPYVTWQRSRIDEHFEALMFRTTMPVSSSEYYGESGLAGNGGTKDVVFTLRSADGLITDHLTVKVLYKQLGLRFHYDGAAQATATTDNGVLNMYLCNPLKLSVTATVSGTLKGYLSYKPNGTAWGAQSKSPVVRIETGGVHEIFGGAVRVDGFQDDTADGGSVSYGRLGFYQYFKSIWDTVGWDSYTIFNGANGYNKHAHPTEMSLSVALSFKSPNSRRLKPDNGLSLPVRFLNSELRSGSGGAAYGAGTDWGFEWDHFDNEGNTEYQRYRFLRHTSTPDKCIYSYDYTIPVGVTINGTDRWQTASPGIPHSETYGEGYFADLGF